MPRHLSRKRFVLRAEVHERVTMPNFLIIGAQKAGTTSLYYYLKQHPQIYMSPIKEPHFFDGEGAGQDAGRPVRGLRPEITTIEEYRTLFQGATKETAIGEASPSYLYIPEAPERIRYHVPEVNLIAVLRNPVERAYSAFLHTVRSGREPLTDFSEALREEEGRIRGNWHAIYHYKNRGFYYGQLKRYQETFGRERIGVYLYEELNRNPAGMAQDIFRFLGVDEGFVPNVSVRYNASGVPRNKVVSILLERSRKATPVLKRFLPFGIRQNLKGMIYAKPPPPLSAEVRRGLIEVYREDILRLQELIGRDLSKWLE